MKSEFPLGLIYYLVFICLCLLTPLSAEASVRDPIILEHAQNVCFLGLSSKKGIFTFEGGVRLRYKEIQLEAEYVDVDMNEGFIRAWGNVVLRQPGGVLWAEEIFFNLAKEKGLIKKAEAEVGGLYAEGREIEIEEERMVIKDGLWTTCDREHNHYKIKAGRLVIYPERSLWAYNVVPYIKDLPFFYLPVYYRSLKHKGPHLFISPGYSSSDGWYLKSRYRIYLEDDHLDLLLDYFEHRGLGEGIDYQYRFKRDGQGGLSLYHIRERGTLRQDYERLKASFSHYQILFEDLTIQGRLDYRSDESLDYDYASGSLPRIQEIDSYLALTKRERDYLLRLLGSRRDRWDGKNFVKAFEEVPKLAVWRRPLGFGPLFYQVKGEAVNQYTDVDDRYSLLTDIECRLFSRLNIGSTFTLVPEIGLRERGGMNLVSGLRLQMRMLRCIKGEARYRFEKRVEEQDLELEEMEGGLDLTFPRWCRIRADTTYDLIDKEYEPLIGQVSLFLPHSFRFDLASRYDIEEAATKGLDISLNKDSQGWDGGLVAYYLRLDGEEDILDLEARLGILVSDKTKVRFKGRYDTRNEEVKLWEASLYQDLHCWKLEFGLRSRPIFTPTAKLETEGWVRMNLKEF